MADVQIPEADKAHVNKRLLEEFDCYPVYLADELADRHYNGMSPVVSNGQAGYE